MGADRADPTIGAQVIWSYERDGAHAQFIIRDGTDVHTAEQIFENTFDYWERLFGDMGYIEDKYFGPD